ncbi:unnamed protein product, partial [Didymodactylos carnosus]
TESDSESENFREKNIPHIRRTKVQTQADNEHDYASIGRLSSKHLTLESASSLLGIDIPPVVSKSVPTNMRLYMSADDILALKQRDPRCVKPNATTMLNEKKKRDFTVPEII